LERPYALSCALFHGSYLCARPPFADDLQLDEVVAEHVVELAAAAAVVLEPAAGQTVEAAVVDLGIGLVAAAVLVASVEIVVVGAAGAFVEIVVAVEAFVETAAEEFVDLGIVVG